MRRILKMIREINKQQQQLKKKVFFFLSILNKAINKQKLLMK